MGARLLWACTEGLAWDTPTVADSVGRPDQAGARPFRLSYVVIRLNRGRLPRGSSLAIDPSQALPHML